MKHHSWRSIRLKILNGDPEVINYERILKMSQINGWLLYTKEDYERNSVFAQRFLDLGNNQKSSIELVFKDDIYYGVSQNGLCLSGADGRPLKAPGFVINRSIDPLFTRHLEKLGSRVFNSSLTAEICNDKARTYMEVSRLRLPMADTLFIDKKTLMRGQFSLGWPAVLKTAGGRGGKEVFLVHSLDELLESAGNLKSEKFVLQKLSGSPGRDVRVFVVGKNIVGAVLRLSKNGGFKANFSLGGTAEPYTLNETEQNMVNTIINHFDFGMVGIDFIFDEKGGFLFNEIEDVVGSRTLSMTSDTDIVKLYLEHIYRCLVL